MAGAQVVVSMSMSSEFNNQNR